MSKFKFIYILILIYYSCNPDINCPTGQCLGDSGKNCYKCEEGSHCTKVKENSNCSNPVDGVYCCPDGGGSGGGSGCIPTGCPSSHPWLCCGKCYTSAVHDTNGDGIGDCSMCRKCP
ncbi:MAG: hypothetical protein ACK4IK_00075 [Bacteroidia bacterium]